MRSSVVCLTCGTVSCSTEPCLDLSLPIPKMCRAAEPARQNLLQLVPRAGLVNTLRFGVYQTVFEGWTPRRAEFTDIRAKAANSGLRVTMRPEAGALAGASGAFFCFKGFFKGCYGF